MKTDEKEKIPVTKVLDDMYDPNCEAVVIPDDIEIRIEDISGKVVKGENL